MAEIASHDLPNREFQRDADLSQLERHIPRGDDNGVFPSQKAFGSTLH